MEIKFRAWDKNKNEMHSAHNPYISQFLACKIADELVAENKRMMKEEDKKFIFMQLTGLLDKNGKEIYVGDIIRVSGIGLLEVKMKGYLQVEFCNKKSIRDFQDIIEEDILIKGNIYQNKDLLDN